MIYVAGAAVIISAANTAIVTLGVFILHDLRSRIMRLESMMMSDPEGGQGNVGSDCGSNRNASPSDSRSD